jgi:hypothetical protein
MKKFMLIVSIVALGTCANAQKIDKKNVPAAVKAKFAALYPNITDPKWDKENGNFEAGFDTKSTGEGSVLFDPKGNLLETEVEIELSQLPKGVLEYVKKNYPTLKVKEASKITDAKGVVTFEAETKSKDLIFNATGKFIKETKD